MEEVKKVKVVKVVKEVGEVGEVEQIQEEQEILKENGSQYLIAIRNQKKPSYAKEVLSKIKELDQLTFQLSIPSASRRNYVNELDLNQNDIEMFSED